MKIVKLSALALLGCIMSACGGDGDDASPTPTSQPDPIVVPDLDIVYGYAALNGGTTGGSGANAVEVEVCTGAELAAALANPDYANVPLTIWVDGVITPTNASADTIRISRSNFKGF